MEEAKLVLEDGTIYEGVSFGANKDTEGEVVFNTGMTGYEEVLTDASYKGEIVTMTYPLIGNYGINYEDVESYTSHVSGFVVKEFCEKPSNWRAKNDIDSFLKEKGISAIAGIDTRALTKKLRINGTMKGIITTSDQADEKLIERAKAAPGVSDNDLVSQVTTDEVYSQGSGSYEIVLIDCGLKKNQIRLLKEKGYKVTVVPASITAEEIMNYKPDGVLVSNGPGDPKNVPYVVETVKELLGKLPIFGICLGHQIIGRACGADTFKLKFGHRGANHPVKDLATDRVYITSQNHGFAIDRDSVEDLDVKVTHINLNDNTVEGLEHEKYPVFSIQYHPEAAPGPRDSNYIFDKFIEIIEENQGGQSNA